MTVVSAIGSDVIRSHLEDLELSYSLVPVKVRIKQNLPTIEVGSVKINHASEGDVIEQPRWVAEALDELGFGEIEEADFESDLFRAFSREKIQSSDRLSTLQGDIYQKMRRHLGSLKATPDTEEEFERLLVSCRDLVTLRTNKLLHHASSPSLPEELGAKLAPEEKALFDIINRLTTSWVAASLEGT